VSTAALPTLTVEIWSDIVCPWCYIGKRRFEAAIDQVRGEVDVHVIYRPFQLDPSSSPVAPTPVADAYAKKFGGEERAAQIIRHLTDTAAEDGLEFRMDRALRANTIDAHRLLWLAAQDDLVAAAGTPLLQPELKERLLQAYFIDGLNVGDQLVLADCAADVGMDRDRVVAFLGSDDGVLEVRGELEEAGELGITAVPTFVFNGSWAVPGAQDADTFAQVLRRLGAKQSEAAAEAAAAAVPAGEACTDDACDV
jgi:predicted DsbA family dithiol-disulfide isomerase